jgi:hypothetical protein
MFSREKLLHPATAIALVALFVSLGGVTYAATTIGTKQIRNGAVTRAKIARGAINQSKIADNAVGAQNLQTGAAVAGSGSMEQSSVSIANGSSATVFNFAGFGSLAASCSGGVATTSFTAGAAGITVVASGLGGGTPVQVHAAPASGTTVAGPPAGADGTQSITWQAETSASALASVGTFWVTTTSAGSSCLVTGQVLQGANPPPSGP